MTGLALAARMALGVVFGVAGGAKLANRAGTVSALEGFGVPLRFTAVSAWALPVVELVIAAALFVGVTSWWGAAAALGLLVVFAGAIVRVLARGEAPDCHCFGQLHARPTGKGTLARNATLVALASIVLVAGPRGQASTLEWLGDMSDGEIAAAVATAVLVTVSAAGGYLMFELLRNKHGRILARLDALDGGTAVSRKAVDKAGSAPAPDPGQNGQHPARGLPLNAPAPTRDPRCDWGDRWLARVTRAFPTGRARVFGSRLLAV